MMRLKVRYSTLLLTSMFLLILSPLCACCQFYIAPSPDLCPGGEDVANGHCLTIEQFAASADLNLGSNVILELVPGNHTLESELFISEDVTDFMMHSTNASVLCSGTNASITLEQVRNIRISGVSFAACAPVKVSSVETFSLNDSSFQVNGTIIISNTLDATIMRSSFQNNALGSHVYWSGGTPPDDIIECCSSGGVHAFNSSLQIHQSVFSNNFGYITGGVYSVNSNITIMDSIFNQNCGFRNVYVDRVPTYSCSGALYATNGTLQLLNSNFSDNSAQRQSGAMFLEGLESLEITSSNFERNRAYFSCGALVIEEAFMSVLRLSKFVNNSDGAVCISLGRISQGSLTIIGSAFIGTEGDSALSVSNLHDSNVSISNSVFTLNKANGFGGAILFYGGPMSISGSNFTSNNASGIGGALCVSDGNVVVNDSSFVGNTAVWVFQTGSTYQEGGAVVIQSGIFTAYRTQFIDNTGSNGGGIHVYTGNIFVHHCNFLRNRATGVGGAIAACACRQYANITITNSTFRWNTADYQCGAVHFLGIQSVNLISGSTFTDNGKFSTREAGVACAKGVTLSVLNSTFSHNLAMYQGGVFLISSHGKVSISQSIFGRNYVSDGSGGVFIIDKGSALQVSESTFSYNDANIGGVFDVDSASLEVNETNFYGNSAQAGTLITACSRSNISLDFDVSLNFTKVNYRNCTLYDPPREISRSIIQATSTITPGPVMTVSQSTQIAAAVGLSSTANFERRILTTTYLSAKATSKGVFATFYPSEKATTEAISTTMTHSHTSAVKLSSHLLTVSTMPLSSMIELTVTSLSVEYYTSTPASPSVAPSSHFSPIFSTVARLSTEESSTVSGNSRRAGPNLGICVAIPIVIFFVAGLILVISLIIIVYYARKFKNCKTVNILTNKRDSSYTHIPLVEAESEGESGDSK